MDLLTLPQSESVLGAEKAHYEAAVHLEENASGEEVLKTIPLERTESGKESPTVIVLHPANPSEKQQTVLKAWAAFEPYKDISSTFCSMGSCTEEERSNLEFMRPLIQRDGLQIRNVGAALQGDRSLAAEAIEQNPKAYEFIGEGLKNDEGLALLAIAKSGTESLASVGLGLRNNPDFMLNVIQRFGLWAVAHLGPDLRKDKDFMLGLMKKCPSLLSAADPSLKMDKEFTLAAIKVNAKQAYAWTHLANDRDVALAALKEDGTLLSEMRGVKVDNSKKEVIGNSVMANQDKEIVLAAVKQTPEAFQHVSSKLKNDEDVLAAYHAHSKK